MNDDEPAPRIDERPDHKAWRVTRELPVVDPDEPLPEPGAPPEPPRRVTLELPVVRPAPIEEQILQVLRSPQRPRETVERAFARRERELAVVFETLDPVDAADLFRRLTRAKANDPVAMSFARLVPERRGRLLAALLAVPRRAAAGVLPRHPNG